MNIRFSGVHVTLVISPTDLRGGFHRLCSLAQDQLGINLSSGKEAVVFLSKMDFSHYFRWLFANFRECSLIS